MHANGFKLNKLIAVGKNVSDVSVEFKDGLNLITGPSDTGKTYIFEAINYMLGASNPPKNILESSNYSRMYLEIELYVNQEKITISRSLIKPEEDIIIYEAGFSKKRKAITRRMRYKHSQTEENNISTFLMEKSGFRLPIKIRKDTNYKKETFTYRGYAPNSMISETKMISENSPAYHNTGYNDRTKFLYQLKYLLTNLDDSDKEEVMAPAKFTANKNASIELLKKLVDEEKNKKKLLGNIKYCSENLQNEQLLKDLMGEIREEISILIGDISKLEMQRKKELESLKYNKSVYKRFELLKQQYTSDIERLQFIDEGVFLMNQLVVKKCPHCGNIVDTDHDECLELKPDLVSESCEYEISEIKLKILDLERAISETSLVISKCESKLEGLNINLDKNNRKLKKSLTPEFNVLQKKVSDLSKNLQLRSELTQAENNIKYYAELISEYGEKRQIKYEAPNNKGLEYINETEFNLNLQTVLSSFYFEKSQQVKVEFYFNQFKELDFNVNEQNRISYGKGSRALLASSFFIAIRNYCTEKRYPHSNFIVLDSPINAFKELEANEKLETSIKNKFLRYLAINQKKFQTIVIENVDLDDIPGDIKMETHIIKFTKSAEGRYGFY